MGDLPEYRCFFVPVGSMMEPELHQPIHTCKKGGFQEIKDRRFNNLQISGPRFIRVASGQEQEKEASGGLRGIDKGLSTHPAQTHGSMSDRSTVSSSRVMLQLIRSYKLRRWSWHWPSTGPEGAVPLCRDH